MTPYFSEVYGNPSSIFYSVGEQARQALDAARERTARALNAEPGEIYFTSCGTEADNWAVKGTARRMAAQGKKHLITSSIEHHAILHSMANNEIGTIEPIAEIAEVCRRRGVLFHTDAVQAVGAIPVDVKALGVDMLSLSAHKFNGPKGVGVLYIRRGVNPVNFMDGGAQEKRRRAGTENLAGIVGLSTALEIAVNGLAEKSKRLSELRDIVLDHVAAMPKVKINGPLDRSKRLPNNVNASFEAAEGESLLLMLDMKGICASSGSACASGSLDPSHVLLAIGLPHEIAHCSLRISFGVQNTVEEARAVCAALDEVVPKVRERSPLWNE